MVFETVGAPTKFLQLIREDPNLSWLLDEEARVAPDDDFYVERNKQRSDADVSTTIYMVLFNQVAIDQLLSCWNHYQRGRMPNGLGAWSELFSCLKSIRRWGPEDRLREEGLLEEILEPSIAGRTVLVEVELWATTPEKRRAAESRVRQLIAEAGGAVRDAAYLAAIRYHALLAELPHAYLDRLLRDRDVDLILADEIYLLGPTPQCAVSIDASSAQLAEPLPSSAVTGEPLVALLDGLPMENHPHVRAHLLVDDPDGWAATYPVRARKHGTAMASLLIHGDLAETSPPVSRPVYVRPILRSVGTDESAPGHRLWLDLIHVAIRRIVATDAPEQPVAPSVQIINLSVGDTARPYLHEPSPLARLLDWLSWKYNVLFIVSAGNHPATFPPDCGDDAAAMRHSFEQSSHRRLLSPAETVNGLTVGALHSDASDLPEVSNQRVIPEGTQLPASYSAVGRGVRRAVKPDLLVPGGRALYRRARPGDDAPWEPVRGLPRVGQKVAVPGPTGSPMVGLTFGTSNAAALTTRAASVIHEAVEELLADGANEHLLGLPTSLLVKALLVHTAEWPEGTFSFLCKALEGAFDPKNAKDHISGILGYGILRTSRALACAPERATCVGGGSLQGGQRAVHRIPLPETLHTFSQWRRLTATVAWFTPINPADRRYRLARLRMDLPRGAKSPLSVDGGQVHAKSTTRGTVQHCVLEKNSGAINLPDGHFLEVGVTCSADAGEFRGPVPYALALSLEVAEGVGLPVYDQVRDRLRPRATIPARPVRG